MPQRIGELFVLKIAKFYQNWLFSASSGPNFLHNISGDSITDT